MNVTSGVFDYRENYHDGNVQYTALSEKELLDLIDHAIDQADIGEVCSLNETLDYIDNVIALK